MTHEFFPGDKVVVLDGYFHKGLIGQVGTVVKRWGYGDDRVLVEFDLSVSADRWWMSQHHLAAASNIQPPVVAQAVDETNSLNQIKKPDEFYRQAKAAVYNAKADLVLKCDDNYSTRWAFNLFIKKIDDLLEGK